jgi:flagellar biosynthetic protein FlhB
MADHGDKSLDPTPHRRQQARERGEFARSQDLTSAGLLLGGLAALVLTGGALVDFLAGLLHGSLSGQSWMSWLGSDAPTADVVAGQWNALVPALAKVLLPLLALMLLPAVGINLLQTGILFLPHKAAPDFSRIDPLSGLSRILSPASGARLAFGVFKIAVIAAVGVFSVFEQRHELALVPTLELPQVARFAWETCLWTCVKIGGALAVLAVLDYAVQRWKHERDLKMTPQEMREEMRNLQGDPQILARRRNVERQLAANRLTQAVPKAHVLIASSTGLAVAVRYDADTMRTPIVIARGRGPIADRIRHLAREHQIAVVEKDTLAASLFREVEVNRPIPYRLCIPVAEVLAYAVQLKSGQAFKAAA